MDFDIHARLIALARMQADVMAIDAQLQAELLPLLSQVDGLKKRIKANNELYERAALEFKADLLAFIAETGDRFVEVPEVTLRKRTRWMYDPDQALTWALTHAPEAIRPTLDKKQFESEFAHHFDGAEQVTEPEIALSKRLGHLLIEDAAGAGDYGE